MEKLEGLIKTIMESLDAPSCGTCERALTEAEIEASLVWTFRPGNEEPMFAMCRDHLNEEMARHMN